MDRPCQMDVCNGQKDRQWRHPELTFRGRLIIQCPEDGYLSVDYSFYASDGTPCTGSTLTVCLLDEDGLVIGVGTEFIEKIGENEKYDGTVKVYGDKDILSLTKGVAMFANPYTME